MALQSVWNETRVSRDHFEVRFIVWKFETEILILFRKFKVDVNNKSISKLKFINNLLWYTKVLLKYNG